MRWARRRSRQRQPRQHPRGDVEHDHGGERGEPLQGLVVLDHVIGKHLYIDYMVALDTTGRVTRVEILQ